MAKRAKSGGGSITPQQARKALAEAPKSARSQALPGMEQVRDKVLDTICEEMADIRANLNAAKTAEKNYRAKALPRMQKRDLFQYTNAGITLIRETGSDTLSVKIAKGDGTVSVGGDASGDDAGDPGEE